MKQAADFIAGTFRDLERKREEKRALQLRRRREPNLTSIDRSRSVYIFFAPEAGVGAHFATHCLIARTLKERGHQVLFVRCDGHYRHCVVMDMFSMPIDKPAERRDYACEFCRERELRMAGAYELPGVDISDLVSPATMREVERRVSSMPADAGEFEVDGIRFGALCASDLALTMKTLDPLRATGEARRMLEAYVAGSLLSYQAARALIRRFKVARLVFFNEYGMLTGAATAAMKAGIPITRMTLANHKNVDRRLIVLLHDPLGAISSHRALDHWRGWRDLPLSPERIASVTDDNLARLGAAGFTVYSPKHSGASSEIFERLQLAPDRRLLVAYTSSLDEFNANRSLMYAFGVDLFQKEQPFPDQIAWLEALIEHVEQSAQYQLVVRIHPREGRNALGKQQRSEHLGRLIERFSGAYKHVRIVWPEDQTSSYDLAELADVALTSWSNIGLELARLGVPVITAFNRYVPFPTPDVVQWAATPDAYFETIADTISRAPSLDPIRHAYRWSNLYTLSIALDFGDVIPTHDYLELPPFSIPAAAPLVERVLVEGEFVVEINRQELANTQPLDAPQAEEAALKRQLRRTVWFLAFGEDRPEADYQLSYGGFAEVAADLRVIPDADWLTLAAPGRSVRRRSRTIARLAQLAANA